MAIKRENDYDASTDEESENPARASLPSGKTRKHCLCVRSQTGFVRINLKEGKILPDRLLCDKPASKP